MEEQLMLCVEGTLEEFKTIIEVLKLYDEDIVTDAEINEENKSLTYEGYTSLFDEIVNKKFANALEKIKQVNPKISFELTFFWEDEDNGGVYKHICRCKKGKFKYETFFNED